MIRRFCILLFLFGAACGDDSSPVMGFGDSGVDSTMLDATTQIDTSVGEDLCASNEVIDVLEESLRRDRSVQVNHQGTSFVLSWGADEAFRQVRLDDDGLGEMHFSEKLISGALMASTPVLSIFLAKNDDDVDEMVAYAPGTSSLSWLGADHDPSHAQLLKHEDSYWLIFTSGERSIQLMELSETGEIKKAAQEIASSVSKPLSLSVTASPSGAAVAWVERLDEERGRVQLQMLDGNGDKAGPVKTLSSENNANGTVSLVSDDVSISALFDVALEHWSAARLRLLDANGEITAPEQVVSNGTQYLRGVHAVSYAGGIFAVYRRPNGDNFGGQLVGSFINASSGEVIDEYVLGNYSGVGGDLAVDVNPSGQLLVVWQDYMETQTFVRARKLACDVAWLRCGAMR